MPFKSKSQVRAFFAKENRGELPKGTAEEWAHKTKSIKALPEHVKKSAEQLADEVLAKLGKERDYDVSKAIGGFQSKKQQRKMFALEARHELPKGKALEWAHDTPDIKHLPEKAASQIADEVLAKLGANVARGIGVFSAGKGGPKALERVMHRESPMQHKPSAPQSQPIEWRKSIGEKPKGEPEMLKFFSLKEAAVDPEVMEAAALKSSGSGASKLWQGLTGLSDDVLMAGMNIKQKMERNKQREKHAAEQVVSSLSMLTKMSEVSKREAGRFFHESSHGAIDRLPGGKADGEPASDFDPRELAMGKQVEQEHTSDPELAEEIAKDHLSEISDYYTRLKRMEDAAPKKEAELPQEQPVSATSPLSQLSPDIIQLLRAQMLVDQAKTAQPNNNDPGDIQRPYQRERENEGQDAPEVEQEQAMRQAQYEHQLAEQMRAQKVEHEYTSRVRRGELAGAVGGTGAGAGLGFLLSKPGGRFAPMAVGGALTGLLGKGVGRHIGQSQGLDYLQQYSGTPWAVQ